MQVFKYKTKVQSQFNGPRHVVRICCLKLNSQISNKHRLESRLKTKKTPESRSTSTVQGLPSIFTEVCCMSVSNGN